eukprot:CAMPEP_0114408438 /NCGR_PEP_ID=MMETSP0102-20121206/22698_1 /TAXON_ID=38822 ORGANISM="Pteridomonas danica, Strain PT" /NCGR_SAMPLE_ID=MMETSP0102 /ASSEMBLY_ACC=CAM_ASM_000212 /LENGTH=45 /DNA_ID= /DNA_START= /DNA_END= /DNA_ORIENTATION=
MESSIPEYSLLPKEGEEAEVEDDEEDDADEGDLLTLNSQHEESQL